VEVKVLLVGVDLAWGEKKHDGVCFLEWDGKRGRVAGFAYPQGDRDLLAAILEKAGGWKSVFATVDAPIVCPNRTGTRPVDRLTHRMFHREHAACHPANLTKCPRPPRIARLLRTDGFRVGWKPGAGKKTVAEVYPHPAMVRMFGIPRIVKYKKGGVAERRKEFRRLQELLRRCLKKRFPRLAIDAETKTLLAQSWSKPVEDRTDALFCALIGLWHWMHRGKRSEVIGDLKTGFILLPEGNKKRIGDSR
jgi:predicted RNase H-like nuclease